MVLAFLVTFMRLSTGQELVNNVTTPLLFLAVVIGAVFGARWPALATAALAALGLVLTSSPDGWIGAAIGIAALLATALVTGELRDRAERSERAVEVANERLRRVALRDALTGLLDLRGFEFALGVEIARETRRGGTFALVLLELNGVRSASDRFGRSVGDTLLQVLADAIEQRIRQSDIPARVADRQFAVILPDTSTGGAEVIAGQILDRFVEDVRGIAPSSLVVGGSFAVSLFPVDGMTMDTLLSIATRRLEEKAAGGTGQVGS